MDCFRSSKCIPARANEMNKSRHRNHLDAWKKALIDHEYLFLQGYTALTPSLLRRRLTQTCHLGWRGDDRECSDGGGWVITFCTSHINGFCVWKLLVFSSKFGDVAFNLLIEPSYLLFTALNAMLWICSLVFSAEKISDSRSSQLDEH